MVARPLKKSPMADSRPWYRQFWPWFLLSLPASVVVAGLTTVYIAFHNADSLVDDSYYQDGLAINLVLEQDLRAQQLNMSADLEFDAEHREIRLQLKSDDGIYPDSLVLSLLHPVDESKDTAIFLASTGYGTFAGELAVALKNRYYLRLQPADAEWRLNGEFDGNLSRNVRLSAND